jgi:hypothetical protein
MIIALYNFLIFFQSVYVLGNIYAAVKFWKLKLKDRSGRYVAGAFGSYAITGLLVLVRFRFAPRTNPIVWWPIISSILGLLISLAGITALTLYLFGWINGVSPKEGDDDAK